MQRRPPSSLRPKKRLAPRCAQPGSIRPTRPSLARKAIRSSPITRRRTGGESGAGSSRDSATGSQWRRKYSPIAVPGPVRTRSSLSAAESMRRILTGSGARRGALGGGERRDEPGERRGLVGEAAQVRFLQARQRFDVLLHQLHLAMRRDQRDPERRLGGERVKKVGGVELVDLEGGVRHVRVDEQARARMREARVFQLVQEFFEIRGLLAMNEIGTQVLALVPDGGA